MRHAVVQRQRIVKVRVFDDVEDRRKGLAPHRVDLRRHLDQSRPHIICRRMLLFVDALAAENLSTVRSCLCQRLLHFLKGRLVDEGAD